MWLSLPRIVVPRTEGAASRTILPDLLFEVQSPSDTADAIAEKTAMWLAAEFGALSTLTRGQTAIVHRDDEDPKPTQEVKSST